MKVGTDAVLLGAWVKIENAKRILEIGTGSGVIALMLAQRCSSDTKIDAVELNEEDAAQAHENVLNSPWPGKVRVHQTAIQNFSPLHVYDLIISNPPFFNNSLLPPSDKRSSARHTHTLSFRDFLIHSSRLLSENGRLAIIIPFQEGLKFQHMAEQEFKFFTLRKLALFSKMEKKQERWLFEFSRRQHPTEESTLTIHENEDWSLDYRNLTKEFYLKF
jgi:Predicted O-methyltransferase